MRVLPYGDRALLVEVDTLDEVLELYPALVAGKRDGIGELVPAARSVLVTVEVARLSLGAAERWIADIAWAVNEHTGLTDEVEEHSAVVEIPVRYNGEDLAEVAALLQLEPQQVIDRHTAAEWRVAFIGFAPGFAYLARPAGDPSTDLTVPRRSTSRPTVPAGSVGLAGEFSGIYPRSSPGGWQLIGTTDSVLWDVDRPQPALLAPGTRVRFVAVPDEAVADVAATDGDTR
ncbi:MAG: hypothetical protein JWQ43_799 [Glaciihabitans sp.]|nr:hypothetical protein [Glaciihabitans sp.]